MQTIRIRNPIPVIAKLYLKGCFRKAKAAAFTMNEKNLTDGSIPLGLGMAFAQNTDAMAYFTSLSKEEQFAVIDQARSMRSKNEMSAFVQSLAEGHEFH